MMEEFLREQKAKIEEELKQLYVDRARSSVETEGSYDIMIDRKKKELSKLNQEINGIQQPKVVPAVVNPKTEIKKLIAKGKIEEAIQELMVKSGDDQLILLSARYNGIKREKNIGIISHDNFSIEYNRITNSLLAILKDL